MILPVLPGHCGHAWVAPWSRGRHHQVVDHMCNEWADHGDDHICACGDKTTNS